MAGPIDAFLKVSVAMSLLGAAGSVSYYYSIYLPARDAKLDHDRISEAARLDYSKQVEQAQLAAEKRDAEEKDTATREAEGRYRTCIAIAERNYTSSWRLSSASGLATKQRRTAKTAMPRS
jgi:hypothetical protein